MPIMWRSSLLHFVELLINRRSCPIFDSEKILLPTKTSVDKDCFSFFKVFCQKTMVSPRRNTCSSNVWTTTAEWDLFLSSSWLLDHFIPCIQCDLPMEFFLWCNPTQQLVDRLRRDQRFSELVQHYRLHCSMEMDDRIDQQVVVSDSMERCTSRWQNRSRERRVLFIAPQLWWRDEMEE